MTNGTKIKTMKDDLLEIENKMLQSSKVPKIKQKPAPASTGAVSVSSAIPKRPPLVNMDRAKNETEDLKTKELKTIIDRISKKKESDSEIRQPESKETMDRRVEQATKEPGAELKELLDRISKRESEAEKPLAQKTEEKAPSIEKLKAVPSPQTEVPKPIDKNLVDPLIRQTPKSKIQLAEPIYPLIATPVKQEKTKENTSLMKKIKERLFGLKIDKFSGPKQPEDKKIEKIAMEDTKKNLVPEQSEKKENGKTAAEDKEYFKKISEEKQQKERKIDKVEEKFSKIPKKEETPDALSNKIDEFANFSGIINNGQEPKEKQKDDGETKRRSNYLDAENYIAPENRLIFGKQEHYSSIRKKVEEKIGDDELDELKRKTVIEKNEILTEKEEQKRLKQRIVSKYHLDTFSSRFKKILALAVIAIVLSGGGLYYYISSLKTPVIIEKPVVISGSELKEFSSVDSSVEITSEQIKKLKALEEAATDKFAADTNIRFFKLIIKDNDGNIVGSKEALEDIGIYIDNFPAGFADSYKNEYNLLVFKTQRGSYRLSVAIRMKDADVAKTLMSDWENDKAKMASELSPLFTSDRMADTANNFFQSGNYKNVFMRYLSLPDKNTAIDYFVYNDALVIATSRDDIFKMIDIITTPQ